MATGVNRKLSRREFLLSRADPNTPVVRPPWTDELRVARHCIGCADCVVRCPEQIITLDSAQRPVISFDQGQCTFCQSCAQACPEPVFDLTQTPVWNVKVAITNECLLDRGVTCQSCTDYCDSKALRYSARKRPAGEILLDSSKCTGCGACVSGCPVSAIEINQNKEGLA